MATGGAGERSPVSTTAARVAAEETTASAALERCLGAYARDNAALNAITVLLADAARVEASQRDLVVAARKPLGPLHGVPIAIKEEIAVAGTVTTFGGLGNVTPATADAEVVRRLRAAGAVIVGKTNMPEFGTVPFGDSDAHGITRNPWDPSRSPGGSSAGSAVAVATGMAAAAMGGDGGGSIRVPASYVGLFGLKPQRGRVTTAPEPHLWWALGTAGPLTRSVLDSAIVYDAIRGSTDTDLYQAGEVGSFVAAVRRDPGRLRVGWSTKPVTKGVRPHADHVRAVEETAQLLTDLGHDVREVDPRYPDPSAAFVTQFFASVRAETDALEHSERLSKRNQGANTLGFWVTPRVREWGIRRGEKTSRKANRVFDDCDVLMTPVTANRPPSAGHVAGKGVIRGSLLSVPAVAYAALWNVAGNPAASVPAGFGEDGLPTAVQLVGPTDGEELLLSLSAQLEAARPWTFPR
jgi:amidase